MKVLSLFSGCGGLDKGFIDAGYEITWANDFDKYAVHTYRKNFRNHIVLGDITEDSTNENETEVLEYIKDLDYHEVQEKIEIMIEKYMA